MKLSSSLKNLVLVFIVLSSLAFQCRNGKGPTSTEPGHSTEDAGGLTEEIVRQQITEEEEAVAGHGGVISVSLSFESIEIGEPQPPSFQEKIDGITSETFHPVRVKFIRIKKQSSEDVTHNLDRNYKFFIDSQGRWAYVFGNR